MLQHCLLGDSKDNQPVKTYPQRFCFRMEVDNSGSHLELPLNDFRLVCNGMCFYFFAAEMLC